MNVRSRPLPTSIDPVLAESVRNGAAWLDEHYPGWTDRITRPIKMHDPNECVLGQVVSPTETLSTGYHAALDEHRDDLVHTFNGSGELGFAVTYSSNMPGTLQWERLAELWERLLLERRAVAAL